jgi:hypothetical protein
MKTRLVALAAGVSLGLAASALAQDSRGAAVATVGGKKVTIDYGRPALKGRSLDVLLKQLPEDHIWRAGENQVTTFVTESDVVIGGTKVPAGKYSVYVYAGENDDWALVLNRDPGIALVKLWDKAPDNLKNELWPRLDGYDKNIRGEEVLRAKMTAATAAEPADLFTMSFAPKGNSAALTLAWGNAAWSIDVDPAH